MLAKRFSNHDGDRLTYLELLEYSQFIIFEGASLSPRFPWIFQGFRNQNSSL
jgi:hypothetical protein